MKRIIMLLLITLLTRTLSFSQDIYPKQINDSLIIITSDQLKETNLIFIEHQYLKSENEILNQQVEDLKTLYNDELEADSLYLVAIDKLKLQVSNYDKLERSNRTLKRSVILTTLLFIVACVL